MLDLDIRLMSDLNIRLRLISDLNARLGRGRRFSVAGRRPVGKI